MSESVESIQNTWSNKITSISTKSASLTEEDETEFQDLVSKELRPSDSLAHVLHNH